MNTFVMVRESVQQEPDLLDFLQRIPQENLSNSRLVLSKQDKQDKGFQFPDYTKMFIPTVQIKLDFCDWCMYVCVCVPQCRQQS